MLIWVVGSIAGAAVVAILGRPLWTVAPTRWDDDPTPVAGLPTIAAYGVAEFDEPREDVTSRTIP